MKQKGFIPMQLVLAVFLISAAVVGTYMLQSPILSNAQTPHFILPPSTYNRDIQSSLRDPQSSTTWDGILYGSIDCFNVTIPSFGAKYRIGLEMDVKDSPTSTTSHSKIIGASVSHLITAPNTLKCGSSTQRGDAFGAPFNLPDRDLWGETCPEIKIVAITEGPWKLRPQEEIGRLSREYVCPGGVPTNTPTPPASTPVPTLVISPGVTASPTAAPIVMTPAAGRPTATPAAPLSGTITVYSCTKPKDVTLEVCDDPSSSACQALTLKSTEADNSVWLRKEQGDDRTYLYDYKVTTKSTGAPITAGSSMAVNKVLATAATIKRNDSTFTSEDDDKNIVTVPGTHDKTIDAQYLTCGCSFRSRAYIKDAGTGAIAPITDAAIGTANDMEVQKFGDKLARTFNNGVIDVRADFYDYAERFVRNPLIPFSEYGLDGLAKVRLYAPGYDVVKQECQSFGESPSCPGYSEKYSKDTNSKDFSQLRITCGTNIEYGWVIQKNNAFATQSFSIEQADVNKDKVINIVDLSICSDDLGSSEKACDLDDNGLVNTTDFTGVIQYLGETY